MVHREARDSGNRDGIQEERVGRPAAKKEILLSRLEYNLIKDLLDHDRMLFHQRVKERGIIRGAPAYRVRGPTSSPLW